MNHGKTNNYRSIDWKCSNQTDESPIDCCTIHPSLVAKHPHYLKRNEYQIPLPVTSGNLFQRIKRAFDPLPSLAQHMA